MNFNALKSKKLWVTVIGGAFVTIGNAVGLPVDTLQSVVGIIAAYVVGQGLADFGKERAKIERLG